MHKEEGQRKTVLLTDLCVAVNTEINVSTVWGESVYLNPSLTSLVVLEAGPGIVPPP